MGKENEQKQMIFQDQVLYDTRNPYKSGYFASKNAIQTSDAGTISIIRESKKYHVCAHLDPKFDYTLIY